jgi:predicted O-linked N-acetylglucosamine transferase (SPINDLY family)
MTAPAPQAALLRRRLAEVPADPAATETLARLGGDARRLVRALAIAPDFVEAWINLGALVTAAGAGTAARGLLRRALALAPSAADGWFNLGVAEPRRERAAEAYRRTLVLDPAALDAATNLAQIWAARAPGLAEPPLERALAVLPAVAPALNALALLRQNGADNDAALLWFRRAEAAAPDDPRIASNALFHLGYTAISRPELLERHLRWARRHAPPSAAPPPRTVPDPARRLRIGYVSADLARHPVGFFLLPALLGRDPLTIETVCYSGRAEGDAMTARLAAAADRWVETASLSDAALAERVRADAVDILVDLSGHTGGHRLAVFAARPAPVQATWMGYPGTTGLAQIDHLIADPVQVPPGEERWYVERIARLEPGYVAYAPPEDAPAVAPLPAARTGRLTFGSLNNLAKINPGVLALWAEVLKAVPGARLLLAWQSLGDPKVQARLRTMAAAAGIAGDRLILRPGAAPADFLGLYGEIDLALDPFPYSGGLTTLEALWMGVPVVTWPGERFAGRHAASHLGQAGLADWIVASPAAYVARAVAAAADLPGLARLRAGLRARLSASPLLDGDAFARRLEALYRRMWRAWCEGEGREAGPRPRSIRRALALEPAMAADWRRHALETASPAVAHRRLGRAMAAAPTALDWSNLAELRRRDGAGGAETAARRALALDPALAAAHNNRGNLLVHAHRRRPAAAAFARALALDPGHREAAYNRAALLAESDPGRAVALYEALLAYHPDLFEARWNRALGLLASGRWRDGWQAHELRLSHPELAPRRVPIRRWDGAPLAGRRLLLAAEQGFGDTLQFLRYVPLAAARGGRVLLDVPAPLVGLARGLSGVERVIESGGPAPEADLTLPLMSLPLVLGVEAPPAPPYLLADPVRRLSWRRRLGRDPRPRIGIAWAGNPAMRNDRRRSLDDRLLAAFADLDEVRLVSLQKDRRPPAGWLDAAPDLLDFADTAALVAELDLVIAVDTAVAHLAGALGRPLWVLLSPAADWRWPHGPRTPWYPNARQMRHGPEEGWEPALARLVRRLRDRPLDLGGDFETAAPSGRPPR